MTLKRRRTFLESVKNGSNGPEKNLVRSIRSSTRTRNVGDGGPLGYSPRKQEQRIRYRTEALKRRLSKKTDLFRDDSARKDSQSDSPKRVVKSHQARRKRPDPSTQQRASWTRQRGQSRRARSHEVARRTTAGLHGAFERGTFQDTEVTRSQ